MNENIIDSLKIPINSPLDSSKNNLEKFYVKFIYLDGNKTNNTRVQSAPPKLCRPTDTFESLIKFFIKKHPYLKLEDEDTYIRYENRLYKNGSLSILQNLSVSNTFEVLSLKNTKSMTQNQGFSFTYWSLPFLLIGISFLIPGLFGKFSMITRGYYVFVSTLIGVPALIFLIIGFSEIHSEKIKTSYTGIEWCGCRFDCNRREENEPLLE